MGRSIVVTSGKGGVGKTTSTANIGTAIALQGKRVCLVDMDIGLRNLDVILGLENRIIYDILDVVEERVKVEQALVKDRRFEDQLYLLPAAQHADKNDITEDQMIKLITELKEDFDFIFIDCPAGIEQGFKNAIVAADEAALITTPELSAIRDADRVIGIMEDESIAEPQVIINRVRPDLMADGDAMSIDEIVQHLSVGLLGVIYEDNELASYSNRGNPVVLDPDNLSAQCYRNIARRILGETVPLLQPREKQEKQSFWHKLKNLFSGN